MKGAAALYSREYFELAREHLNEGGVITQWVPLYESTLEAVKSEMVTFFRAFPEGTVWGNTYDGGGYDVVMAAKKGGGQIDVDAFVDRLASADHSNVATHLSYLKCTPMKVEAKNGHRYTATGSTIWPAAAQAIFRFFRRGVLFRMPRSLITKLETLVFNMDLM